jgi:hypothetical protein
VQETTSNMQKSNCGSSGKLGLCMQRRSSSKSSAAPLDQSKTECAIKQLAPYSISTMQSDHSLNAHTVPQPQRLSPPHLSRTIHLVFHGIILSNQTFVTLPTWSRSFPTTPTTHFVVSDPDFFFWPVSSWFDPCLAACSTP